MSVEKSTYTSMKWCRFKREFLKVSLIHVRERDEHMAITVLTKFYSHSIFNGSVCDFSSIDFRATV